jgi:two-component system chemotaxis response regulator CheB
MSGKLKVIVLSSPTFTNEAKDFLSKDTDIDITLFTNNLGEVMIQLANDRKRSIAALLVDNSVHMAGADFFKEVNEYEIPIVVIASGVPEGFRYLNQGAADMIVRRDNGEESLSFFYRMVVVHLMETVKKFNADKNRSANLQSTFSKGKVIAIGSSTGGTETVLHILKLMPSDAPPIVIVQHMPPVFTKLYAERADSLCKIKVWEAKNSDYLANGLALIAPGGKHMAIKNHGSGLVEVKLNSDPPVWSQRPSVDVLFNSVAVQMGAKSVGVILTGMGEDGAEGLFNMRKKGAHTIGQDKDSSIVYGMPKAAFERGAVSVQLPLEKIAQEILENAYK